MSVTINFSKNTSAPWQSNANMLKSTREKIQRQEERDGKIAFFETQKQNLKNQKADTIEEIAKKLEKFHTYEDEIAAAKQEYNSSQMFHILDEAEERGEQMAKAAEKYKPKTEEEQKKEAQGEAAGTDGKTDDKGVLSEIMDDMSESIDAQGDIKGCFLVFHIASVHYWLIDLFIAFNQSSHIAFFVSILQS